MCPETSPQQIEAFKLNWEIKMPFEFGLFLTIGAIVFVVIILSSIIFIVNGKTAKVLETFGRPHRSARMPGLNFKLPWPITMVVGTVNLQIREIDADVSVKTLDNAFVMLPVKVQYRASDEPHGAVKAFYELTDPAQQISSYVLNMVRQTASGMEMSDLYSNRDSVENEVQGELAERFAHFGFIIENVLVDEPQPSREVQQAFNRVIASHRLREAAQNEAEAERIRLVGTARAEAESKQLQGEGIAQMRRAIAAGLEEAMEAMRRSGLSPDAAIELLNETNRLDTISTAAHTGNLVIMDTRGETSRLSQFIAAQRATQNVSEGVLQGDWRAHAGQRPQAAGHAQTTHGTHAAGQHQDMDVSNEGASEPHHNDDRSGSSPVSPW